MVEGMNAAMTSVRPGVRCQDVELAWRKVLARAGYAKRARIGYSIGLDYPPDWGEHTASLRLGDATELMPNMTLRVVCGMRLAEWGVQLSETFRVTESGHTTFSKVPRQLFVKP